MIPQLLLQVLIGGLVGAVIGFVTNQLAVWMLFHPRRRLRFLGIYLPLTPGLVVKNRDRLAEAVGEAVAADLLDPSTLVEHLRGVRLREPVKAALQDEHRRLLATEETLLDKAGEKHRGAVGALRRRIASRGVLRGRELAREAADHPDGLSRLVLPVLGGAADRPLRSWFPPDRQHALAEWLRDALLSFAARDAVVDAVAEWTPRLLRGFLASSAAAELRAAAESRLEQRAPQLARVLQASLAEWLGREEVSAQMRETLAARLHAVLVGRFPKLALLIRERLVREVLRQNWEEIIGEIQRLIMGETVTDYVTGQMVDKGRQQLEEWLEWVQEAEAAGAMGVQLRAGWAAEVLPRLEAAPLADQLERLLDPVLEQTPRAMLEWLDRAGGPGRELLKAFAAWLESEEGGAAVQEAAEAWLERALLNRPIASLAGLVPEEDWELASETVGEVVEERILAALPKLLSTHLDLREVVGTKIRGLDIDEVEATLLRVSGRELKGIVYLGGLIGFLVGALTEAAKLLMGAE